MNHESKISLILIAISVGLTFGYVHTAKSGLDSPLSGIIDKKDNNAISIKSQNEQIKDQSEQDQEASKDLKSDSGQKTGATYKEISSRKGPMIEITGPELKRLMNEKSDFILYVKKDNKYDKAINDKVMKSKQKILKIDANEAQSEIKNSGTGVVTQLDNINKMKSGRSVKAMMLNSPDDVSKIDSILE